mmetsp:Transcript_8466/g.20910  ORF Transcript_8466/g.20910 Transcript_8466/m.20910 type:complete len:239 (-) Transcript_8466:98-814(-)
MAKKKKNSAGGQSKAAAAANVAGAAKGMIWVDPSRCRFQHSRIRAHFSGCGRSVHETLEDIQAGTTKISDLPPIQVIVGGGSESGDEEEDVSGGEPWYFSLNNRRLWVLKRLRDEGFLEPYGNKVAVRVRQPKSQKEKERYTLANCSLDAKLMGDKKQAPKTQDRKQKIPEEQPATESVTAQLRNTKGGADDDSESSDDGGDEASVDEENVSETIGNRFGGMMMDYSSSSSDDSDDDE